MKSNENYVANVSAKASYQVKLNAHSNAINNRHTQSRAVHANRMQSASSSVLLNKDPLHCRKDAARYLGIAPQTLAQWATSKRYQLAYVKIGRKVMYRLSDLDAFIAANTRGMEA